MTPDNIDKLIQMNQRLLLVMGYATSVILELGKYVPEEQKQGVHWVIEAIENIVYLDKPLPPMPYGLCMSKVTHIYSSDKEIDEIFEEGVRALDRALELFTMISHQDSCAKIIAQKTYKLFLQAEDVQKGWTPDDSNN